MKKLFLMLAVAALSAQTMSAQTVEESKNFDNWYIGINGGVQAPAKNFKVLKNLNPAVGLRVGRWFTPAVGFAVEGQTFLGDKPLDTDKTFKGFNLEALGTVNFSNWLGGYPGEPRSFEVIGLVGIGWGHAFNYAVSNHDGKNSITSKLAADFAFNLGAAKAVQLYIEPYIMYGLTTQRHSEFNLNSAVIGGLVGLNYKFGNSNGTHNFKIAELRDQAEIDGLNSKINELRANLNDKDAVISAKDGQIRDLELNQKLSEDRANAVKTALIKKYKIAADRLTAIGCGPTDQLFEEIEFNRVATFNDMAK
jgi:hypothetical protein